ncbi:PstS family phosphate ABC transporter substrate-binding protein [Sphingomonas panacisoli]|nr:substrate-binding domain-containing protein [Sphingomonas panacisoli]
MCAGLASAQDAAPPSKPGQLIWVEPSAAPVFPQTEEEKKAGMVEGRTLPAPELLQPDLDPALPRYIPTKGLKLKAHFRAGVSDVLPGLAAAWVAAFRKYHPGFQLDLVKPYAGSLGALELIKGNLDLVFVSRELKPTDISGFNAKFGYPPFSVPISGGTWRHFGFLDAIAFMVNPDNPIRKLSFEQLDAAFSSTRLRGGKPIKTWGDLGLTGEWANRPVHLYGIKPWNGFEEFVREHVLSTPQGRGEWNDKIHYDETFFNIARRVAADPEALGYTGLSAIDSEVKIVPLSVEGGPALSPSYENVASAAYPLSRVLYLNTNARSGAALNPALREFLRFVLSREGQAVVRKQGIYLPLRVGQVARSQAYIEGK